MNRKILERAIELGRKALGPEHRPPGFPDRIVFVTISGAHLYGFPSPDSDIDLRGAHLIPLRDLVGLRQPRETEEILGARVEGVEIDCVTHEIGKYLRLLTRKNGYILEQILSPLVVIDGGCLEELRTLARGAITRHVVHHYKGFFATQEKLLRKGPKPMAKGVLYLYRVAMTCLHLLRTGEVEANLMRLNEEVFRLGRVTDLVARKVSGTEKGALDQEEYEAALAEAKGLEAQMDAAFADSALPEAVGNLAAIEDFLVRMRLQGSA